MSYYFKKLDAVVVVTGCFRPNLILTNFINLGIEKKTDYCLQRTDKIT